MIRMILIASVCLFTASSHLASEPWLELLFENDVDNTGSTGSTHAVGELLAGEAAFAEGIFPGTHALDNQARPENDSFHGTMVQFDALPAWEAAETFTLAGWYRLTDPIPHGSRLCDIRIGAGRVQINVRSDDNPRLRLTVWDAEEREDTGASMTHNSLVLGNRWSDTNVWHFWAVVYDASQTPAEVTWYKGNQMGGTLVVQERTMQAGPLPTGPVDLIYGGLNETHPFVFPGLHDRFRLYEKALDREEIERLYRETSQ